MSYLQEYEKLRKSLPRYALAHVNNENCDFCNYIDKSKNCYLTVNTLESEKCMYGRKFFYCNYCIDCDFIEKCELCYECIDCEDCYNCNYLQDCENCLDCEYGLNLKACKNCFCCANLRQKQCHIFNKKYSKEEYENEIQKIKSIKESQIKNKFTIFKKRIQHEQYIGENNENSTGNHIINNQNTIECFDTKECRDCLYSYEIYKCEDCMDIMVGEFSKWNYNCISSYHLHNSNLCYNCWESSDLEYCEQCYQCDNCFFCINLRHKKFHIFNEAYSEKEYSHKKSQIIEKMKAEKEYGKWLASTYPLEDSLVYSYF